VLAKGWLPFDTLRRIPNFNCRIVGFIDPEPNNRNTLSQGIPVLGTFDNVEEVVARHRIKRRLCS
jgi:FlaA1/EpsC-like NDP-sugar epimerase